MPDFFHQPRPASRDARGGCARFETGKAAFPLFRAGPGFSRALAALAVVSLFLVPRLCLAAASGEQASWKAVITDYPSIPPYLIAVDKSRQELSFFERRSPLQVSRIFACTTGQAVGDKLTEGDLKTPEGIYFVVQRIGSGLDYVKYGNEAYTLNYPNPIDRLRKKTGYGIWIHGRGEPLVPLQTEGCVSLNNDDLALLSRTLVPGTPVALTESFEHSPEAQKERAATSSLLRDKVEAWARAWSARSRGYFDFYDKNAYSIAQGEPFSAFQAQKERLFKSLPWIRTEVRDIQVLQGPDYWVTWFYQDYQAPNLSTRGVRRLYWAPDGRGDFKILGMEWHPGQNTTLVASASPMLPPLERQTPVWPDGLRAGARTPSPSSVTAEQSPPAAAPLRAPDQASPAVLVAEISGTPALPSTASDAAAPRNRTSAGSAQAAVPASADHVEDPKRGVMARPSAKALEIARKIQAAQGGRTAPGSPSPAIATAASGAAATPDGHPALGLPPALPAQGLAGSPSANAPAASAAPLLLSGTVEHVPAQTPQPEPARPPEPEPATAPLPEAGQGEAPWLTPHNEPGQQSLSSAETASPARAPEPAPLIASIPESRSQTDAVPAQTQDNKARQGRDVPELVEAWRSAWETGNLNAYIKFYAPKAKQGPRGSASSIRKQKQRLWSEAAPVSVTLTGLQVTRSGAAMKATMRQKYTDSRDKGDLGIKTLTFENINGVWLITQEDWSPLPDEAGN